MTLSHFPLPKPASYLYSIPNQMAEHFHQICEKLRKLIEQIVKLFERNVSDAPLIPVALDQAIPDDLLWEIGDFCGKDQIPLSMTSKNLNKLCLDRFQDLDLESYTGDKSEARSILNLAESRGSRVRQIAFSPLLDFGFIGMVLLNCPNTKSIHLQNSRMNLDRALRALSDCKTSLKELNLAGCNQNLSPSTISTLPTLYSSLSMINLSSTRVNDNSLASIARGLPDLECISLSHNISITGLSIIALGTHCKKLRCLNVEGCSMINLVPVMSEEVSFPKLQYLNLRRTLVNDFFLEDLSKKCSSLTHLNIASTWSVSGSGLQKIAEKSPNLSHLHLAWLSRVSRENIAQLARNCPKLEHLEFIWCQEIKDEDIEAITRRCKNLTHFNLSGCTSLTDRSITSIAINASKLSFFDFTWCKEASNESIKYLSLSCPGLKHFSMSQYKGVSSEVLRQLNRNCKKLESLSLASSSPMIRGSLINFYHLSSSLRHLSIDWGKVAANAEVGLITQRCPHLESLSISAWLASPKGIKEVFENLPKLKRFKIKKSMLLNDPSPFNILEKKNLRLRILEIKNCCNISDKNLIKLLSFLPNLKHLNIRNCSNITKRGLHIICSHKQNLEITSDLLD